MVKDGRLAFSDSSSYITHYNWILLNQGNPELIKEFNRKIGFKSMGEIYDDGMHLMEPTLLKEYILKFPSCFKAIEIDNSIFYDLPLSNCASFIASPDGIYQVGDMIIKEAEGYKLSILNCNASLVPELLLNPSNISNPQIYKNVYKSATATVGDGQYSYKTAYFNTKLRIVARLYCWEGRPGGNGYEIRTTSQQKVLGTWWQDKINKLGFNQSMATWYYNGVQPPSNGPFYWPAVNDDTRTNIDDIRYEHSPVWPPIDFNLSSCMINHFGERSSGRVEINNNDWFPDL